MNEQHRGILSCHKFSSDPPTCTSATITPRHHNYYDTTTTWSRYITTETDHADGLLVNVPIALFVSILVGLLVSILISLLVGATFCEHLFKLSSSVVPLFSITG